MSLTMATRTGIRIIAAALWAGAAWKLWGTIVPGLDLADVPLDVPAADVERARDYARVARLFVVGGLLAPLIPLLALVGEGPSLDRRLPGGALVRSLSVLGIVLVVAWAARLPFAVALHWWRRRHGLSHQPYLEWAVSAWPESLAFAAAAALALVGAIGLARVLGGRWWIAGAPLLAGVGAAVVLVQPLVLAPRLEPLRDARLAAEIRGLARQAGLGEIGVDVERASDRTTALNAEVAGIGPTRRVIVWDTVLAGRVTRREARFLVAHELAHVERRHLWKGLAWLALATPFLVGAAAWATRGRGGISSPAAVPAAVLALVVSQLALLPLTSLVSRRYEAEADWRALQLTRDPGAARSLFRRWVGANLADPNPPAWARLALGTHPPLERRAALVAAWDARR